MLIRNMCLDVFKSYKNKNHYKKKACKILAFKLHAKALPFLHLATVLNKFWYKDCCRNFTE